MVQLLFRASRFVPALVLALFGFSAHAFAPGTDAQIRDRIQPFGELRREIREDTEADAVAREPRAGGDIYSQFCATCHEGGVAGAPRMVAAEWDDRIAKGLDTLYENTITGIGAMPPRGTCNDCTDEELEATVDYMLDAL